MNGIFWATMLYLQWNLANTDILGPLLIDKSKFLYGKDTIGRVLYRIFFVGVKCRFGVSTPNVAGSGGMPPRNFLFNLQPLRLLLVASETRFTHVHARVHSLVC